MSFNYEQSIWGRGVSTLKWSDPANFRLRQALQAISALPSGARVLEIGCGAGQFIRAVKKLRPDLDCFGCDISLSALDAARSFSDNIEYALSAERTLPYSGNSFDAVLIFDVLEHVTDPAAMVGEMKRVLKPGGIAYCFVPCEGDNLSLWHALDILHLKRNITQKYAGHINYFSRHSLLGLFKKDFDVISVRYSEHIFGQLLGVFAFCLMHRTAKKRGITQINNETFFQQKTSGPIRLIKNLVNTVVYFESIIFCRLPSPNAHLTLRKKI